MYYAETGFRSDSSLTKPFKKGWSCQDSNVIWKGFVRLIGANSETKKPPAGLLGLQTVLMATASAL